MSFLTSPFLGYWYVSTILEATMRSSISASSNVRKSFATTGDLPADDKVARLAFEIILVLTVQSA